ncbi:hypothetical protein HMPREF0765_4886 [Sphingobacterium spiritivorum ATCC 33300]|uniref:Predicted integral membrane protein linked to a cation pump n=2 Tax=Sphingobacterium spiritivorum TaxID=258 RepID=A0A380BP93_SPHSI|nr:FixH family protein [Sphingobacterium spiritivorum]EEI89519.1 hypothetical protein HMPREF0765_4886 [Sphingobacterium spiritivorum ATCC 33300]QQS94529.1 FixH family protein [Sphingobacterium spiritivorum]SUJ04624.1 Predicted integral membrane protein linked to a cation pump [Sphingobacterium spiritivorum]
MNWGKKIVVSLAVFMSGIIGAGIYMVSHNADTLEEEDYYEKGLNYDDTYNRKSNVIRDHAEPVIKAVNDTLYIDFQHPQNKGKLVFKRPSDSHLDISLPFATASTGYRLPIQSFQKGRWSLEIQWEGNAVPYIFEKHIFL